MAVATVVQGVVQDLLHQSKYEHAHFPESVDLAVLAMGLGMLRSQFELVSKEGTFWDSTQWHLIPRPFLDQSGQTWTHAINSWIRDQSKPDWYDDLPTDMRRNVGKFAKQLAQSKDCFVNLDSPGKKSTRQWLESVTDKSQSIQLVAIRHLEPDAAVDTEIQKVLHDKLRSNDTDIVLHAIAATSRFESPSTDVIDELQYHVTHRDDQVRAKAMICLARMGKLDERTLETAGQFLDSKTKHVTYAGLVAVSTLDKVPEDLMPPVNRAFLRSLSECNYEFVGLFAMTFLRWFDDPKKYVREQLQEHHREFLAIAEEAIDNAQQNLVQLDS